MIVHLTPMKSVLSAEVEFEFYFCVLEKGYIILIWTLSLWDLKLTTTIVALIPSPFELCPYGIWNFSFVIFFMFSSKFELCPYGIWNFKSPLVTVKSCIIWTLSLWDLKPQEIKAMLKKHIFELCPYGIWNFSIKLLHTHRELFELCPYGIWNCH